MDDAERVIEKEIALQDRELRRDPAAVLALLMPEFVEVDGRGQVWNAEGVTVALAAQTGYVQPQVSDLDVTRLAPDVQLLTYRDDTTYHSSIWVRVDSGEWRLRFHQQTYFSG
jgi:ribonuclease HI